MYNTLLLSSLQKSDYTFPVQDKPVQIAFLQVPSMHLWSYPIKSQDRSYNLAVLSFAAVF